MKACTLFSSDNEVAEDWLVKFNSREPLDIYGQKYLIDEISTDYEHGFAGVTIKMYPVYQAKSPERPKKQGAWDAGDLPPVGITCEVRDDDENCWVVADVYVHTEFKGDTYACAKNESDMFYGLAHEFRPIKTAEQLAEEERERTRKIGVAQMMEHIHFSLPKELWGECEPACYALYEAGYRKQ